MCWHAWQSVACLTTSSFTSAETRQDGAVWHFASQLRTTPPTLLHLASIAAMSFFMYRNVFSMYGLSQALSSSPSSPPTHPSQLEMALVSVLNLSLALEDPFDNLGMDGVFIDEALFEVQQVLNGEDGAASEAVTVAGAASQVPGASHKDPETGDFGNAQGEEGML